MKKLLPLALICTAAFAHAHEVWVNAPAELPAKSSLKVCLRPSKPLIRAKKQPEKPFHFSGCLFIRAYIQNTFTQHSPPYYANAKHGYDAPPNTSSHCW